MRLSQICIAIAQLGRGGAWSPLSLWPDGIDSPGMWISPRDLTSQWQDYLGTTPVVTPGTVADTSNPVGLALDIRAGAPEVLGPELVVNGDFAAGSTGWTLEGEWTVSGGQASITSASDVYVIYQTALTPGKTYEATVTVTDISVGGLAFYCGAPVYSPIFSTTGQYTAILVCGGNGFLGVRAITAGTTASIDNISFKEVPGNHMLQSTSAARPLMSARVNWLTHTNDFADATWADDKVTSTENATTAPDGTTTACKIAESSATGQHVFQRVPNDISMTAGAPVTLSWCMKDDGVQYVLVTLSSASWYASATFDIVSGSFVRSNYVASNTYISGSAEVTPLGSGWYRVSASFMPTVTEMGNFSIKLNRPNINTQDPSYAGDGVSGVYVWHPQIEYGPTATAYQEVITAADYATAFPIFQKYDGVDDGMATAAFSAGTLINGMDCMIPVRRNNNNLPQILGLYQADQTKYFGVVSESSPNFAGTFGGCGTPTIFVNNVETANTRGDLFDAMPFGEWCILEYRGLDLSAWVNANFGNYSSGYAVNGSRGDILLYPSTDPTEDKDAARQWLADYYGVTLP